MSSDSLDPTFQGKTEDTRIGITGIDHGHGKFTTRMSQKN